MKGERFTAYLSPEELQQLREEAEHNGTTINFIVRVCIREHFGMGVPRMDRVPTVTVVTRNSD